LIAENALLRQQLIVVRRQIGRPVFGDTDRFLPVFGDTDRFLMFILASSCTLA